MSQSIAGTNLAANAALRHRSPTVDLKIAWGETTWPDDWEADAYDESARLISATWQRDLPMGISSSGRVAGMTLVLDNHDQRFSPFNTSSPIYADLIGSTTNAGGDTITYPKLWRVPVRLRTGFVDSVAGAETVVSFSGYIIAPAETYGVNGATVTLSCLDRGAVLLDQRKSTTTRQNWTIGQWAQYLVSSLAGIEGGTYYPGIFPVPWLWMDDEGLWQELQTAASADGGWFFFDELGLPQFRAAYWFLHGASSKASQWDFTTAKLQNIQPVIDYTALGTGITVDYEPRYYGGIQDAYTLRDPQVVPGNGTEARWVHFSYPVTIAYLPTGENFIVTNGSGVDVSASVTITWDELYAQRAKFTIENHSAQSCMVWTLVVIGKALIGPGNRQYDFDVGTSLVVGEAKKRLSGNPYVQTEGQAQMLARLHGDRQRYPRLSYRLAGVQAVPWLQLGDMITITASEPFTTGRTAIITGLQYSYSTGGFSMSVEAVDTAALHDYATSEYFIIGTNKYGGDGDTGAGRVFL